MIFDPYRPTCCQVFLNKPLVLLHYSFRAMGYIQTKINLPFLDKEEYCVFSLDIQNI
jgi:hypothetical protein